MKKMFLALALAVVSMFAMAGPLDPADIRIPQNIEPMIPGGPSTGTTTRYLSIPATGVQELVYLDGTTRQPGKLRLGAGLAVTSGQLTATAAQGPAGPQGATGAAGPAGVAGATTWAGITDKPTTFAPTAHTHTAAQISDSWPVGQAVLTAPDAATARAAIAAVSSSDTRLTDARTPLAHLHPISDVTGLQTALNGKFPTPTGTTAQYLRGDGSLGTMAAGMVFNYGDPVARTLALSTAYQALDITKAADVTLTLTCRNQSTLLAASACTAQIRYGITSTSICTAGTTVATWTSTYALGLVLDNTSGSPVNVRLGAGRFFAICPTAGTFTVAAVDQAVG